MILKTKIHIAIFCTGCKILITLLTYTAVEYYYFGRQKICKIKMEPFLNSKLICPPMKISILKMESLETVQKALRLSFLIGTLKMFISAD